MNIKRNFLIAIMILCAGFVSAQSTVRGFTAGGSTGKSGNASETYVVFGQQFGLLGTDAAENYEASEGLAQMQLTTDTVEVVVSYGDGYYLHLGNTTFTLSADSITKEVAKHPRQAFFDAYFLNGAQYHYDSALVLHIYQCDSSVIDVDGNEYGVVAMNNECWTTENLRAKHYCDGDPVNAKGEWYVHEVGQSGAIVDPAGMEYVSPQGEEIPKNMGLLYTWEAASNKSTCDETFNTPYLQGVCPCGWHLPTPEEMQYLRTQATQTLRADDPSWVNGSGNNYTRFSALPAGYYNSTNQRFEGYHTEADFWGVADCGNETDPASPTYLQIAYFCDYTLQETRIAEDGLSVRCVFPILDYEKMDPTPSPDPEPTPEPPTPTPETSCASLTNFQTHGDTMLLTANVENADENTSISISYTAVYENVDQPNTGTVESVSFDNNSLVFRYTDYEGDYVREDLISVNCTLYVNNANGECNSYQEIVYQKPEDVPEPIDCPGLSQIITDPNYGYQTTITQYDENAGEFRVEYHVYLAGETEPEMVQEDNAIFTPDNSDGSMNVSGYLSSEFWQQYENDVINSIEVFLIYTPSDLYSDQCSPAEVSATLYPAQVDDACPVVGTPQLEPTPVANSYFVSVQVTNYDADKINPDETEDNKIEWNIVIGYNDSEAHNDYVTVVATIEVVNGVATFRAPLSVNNIEDVKFIKVDEMRFYFVEPECSPNGDDAYDVTAVIYGNED